MESTRIVKARGGKLLRLTLGWSGNPEGSIEYKKIHGDFFAHPRRLLTAWSDTSRGNRLPKSDTGTKRVLLNSA